MRRRGRWPTRAHRPPDRRTSPARRRSPRCGTRSAARATVQRRKADRDEQPSRDRDTQRRDGRGTGGRRRGATRDQLAALLIGNVHDRGVATAERTRERASLFPVHGGGVHFLTALVLTHTAEWHRARRVVRTVADLLARGGSATGAHAQIIARKAAAQVHDTAVLTETAVPNRRRRHGIRRREAEAQADDCEHPPHARV